MLGRRREGRGAPFSLPDEEEGRGGGGGMRREDEEDESGFETERFVPMKISVVSLDASGTKMRDPEVERVMGEGELGVPGTLAREEAKAEGGCCCCWGVRASWKEEEGWSRFEVGEVEEEEVGEVGGGGGRVAVEIFFFLGEGDLVTSVVTFELFDLEKEAILEIPLEAEGRGC